MSSYSTTAIAVESVQVDKAGQGFTPGRLDVGKPVSDRISVEKNPGNDANKKEETQFSPSEIKQLASDLNEYMDGLQTSLGFFIREEGKQVIVEIKNRETEELIRQIPSEEMLAIREKMAELTGLILDQSA